MRILGLQKTTLLDYPGRIACTAFLGGCDFACPYCHNSVLVTNSSEAIPITQEEFFGFLSKRKRVIEGVCVSGGEPLMNHDIGDFLEQIKRMGFLVKIDTNGSYPKRLTALVNAGLIDYIAMDIKAPQYGYAAAIGVERYDITPVVQSADCIMRCGVDYEFRTTAVKGLIDQKGFIDIGKWLCGAKRYFIQAFRDAPDLLYKVNACDCELSEFTKAELVDFANAVKPYFERVEIRGID